MIMRFVTSVFALILAASASAQNPQFATGQAARLVIGQPHFDAESDSATQTTVGSVSGVAYANNTLFVADANQIGAAPVNNRVLLFNDVSTQLPPPTADLPYVSLCPVCVGSANVVLGQPDYTTTTPAPCVPPPSTVTTTPTPTTPTCPTGAPQTPIATGMRVPTAVASDGTHLVVADTQNNRVLIWNTIPANMNQAPDVVVGQSGFTTATFPGSTPTASSLRGPQGVWIQNGKLYIADTLNDRILIYNSIPASSGASADVVLGQPNFTTYVEVNIAQQKTVAANNNLLTPVSVTSDGTRLFVTDLGFNRVLIWNTIPTSNQAPADVVVGQPDMVSSLPNNAYTIDSKSVQHPVLCTVSNGTDTNNNPTYPALCKYTLSFPRYALSDGTRLFVSDGGNDRVLVFNTIPTSNAAGADVILGQISDTVDQATDAADSLDAPMSLAWDGDHNNLYVADCYNQRVLVYTPAGQDLPTTAVRNSASLYIYAHGTVTFGGTIKTGDKVTVTIQSKNYVYTLQSGDNFDSIVAGMVALINAGSGDPNVIATADTPVNLLVLTARTEGPTGNSITLTTSVSSGSQITATASSATLSGGGNSAAIAPGTLVTLFGTNLSDVSMSAPAGVKELPTSLGGVSVYFNGIKSPLMYVSAGQINSQMPFQLGFISTGSVNAYVRIVHADGSVTATNATGVLIVPANPGIFANAGTEPRPAVAEHASVNATGVVSVDGTIAAGDTGTICIGSSVSGCTGGRTYTYTVQASDTLATVEQALVALVNADSQVTAHASGAYTRIVIQARVQGPSGNGIPFQASVSASAHLLLTAIGPAPPSPGVGALLCCATNGGPITSNSPAIPGELITVYGAGLGLPVLTPGVDPYVITGQVYEGPAANAPQSSVSSLTSGKTAQVIAAGLMPGTIGIYQVFLLLNTSLPTDPLTQLTIAQDLYVSNIVTFPVFSTNAISAFSCNNIALNSSGTATCTVTLTQAATGNGTSVTLSSNNSLLTVPSSVTVASGATTGTFTATAGTIPSSQTAVITATLGSNTQTVTFALSP
jgi:uncharacterized protein (TIGR03437 family)